MWVRCRMAWGLSLLLVAILLSLTLAVSLVAAQPARGLQLIPEFTNIAIGKEEDARLNIKVANTGKQGEFVNLLITSVPQGWEARFTDFSFNVRSIYVAPGKEQEVNFRAKPPKDVATGDYRFPVRAITQDGQVQTNLEIVIGIQEKGVYAEKLKMVTLYPSMSTPAGTSLQFNVDLTNEGATDRTYELITRGVPALWTVSVQPAYEKKEISTISLKAAEQKGVNLVLTAPDRQAPGKFPFTFTARSGSIQDTLELTVDVTGSYELTVTTPTGRLNAEVTAGREGLMSLLVANTGTAEVKGLAFFSTKPEGWDIKFEPDKLDTLAARDFKEVTVRIKAPDRTIAGDYVVSLSVTGERTSDTKQIRVTVNKPTRWGVVGVGIVVVVFAGLVGVFVRLGRR